MLELKDDEYFMRQAYKEAQKAFDEGEIPVGSVVVCQNQIIARAHNQTQLLDDVTAHAEMLGVTTATSNVGYKYLNNCTLYVTLEPCVMCAGALFWAKLGKLVYGAKDEKQGYTRYSNLLHPKTKVFHGIMAEESRYLLQAFFQAKRKKSS